MSKPIQYGKKLVYAIPAEIKPIIGLPPERIRLRFRNTSVARAFVKTATGIEHFVILDNGDTWGVLKQGQNIRLRP